jgi:hypothetical protein
MFDTNVKDFKGGFFYCQGFFVSAPLATWIGSWQTQSPLVMDDLPDVSLKSKNSPSNMVYLTLDKKIPFNTYDIAALLKEAGILVAPLDPRQSRLVTHFWISYEDIQRSVDAFKTLLRPY